MKLITNVDEAAFLKTASVISLDIETETTAPTLEWQKRKFGLSYVAPITHVSFYTDGFDPVVFNAPLPEEFIRAVLERPGYTLVGHNVVFDVRSLCGHLNIMLPKGVKVWDTQVIALRTLLAEPDKHEASLTELVQRFCWRNIFYDCDKDFYAKMKSFRADFASIDAALKEEIETAGVSSPLLLLYGTTTQEVIDKYVVMDTILTYYLYEFERNFIENVAASRGSVAVEGRKIGHWEQLPGLIEIEQKISWTSCRQAISGVHLDKVFLNREKERYQIELTQAYKDLYETQDLTSPYKDFENDFAWMLWYYIVLQAVHGETYSKLKQPFLDLLKPIDEDKLGRMMEDEYDWFNVLDPDEWIERLMLLNPGNPYTKATITKSLPRVVPPSFTHDALVNWVQKQCFPDDDYEGGRYKAELKVYWMMTKCTETDVMTIEESFSKKAFRYYYLFCMCGCKLPDSEDIKFNPFLVTKKFQKLLKEQNVNIVNSNAHRFDEDDDGETEELILDKEVDLRTLALMTGTLSSGKRSVDFYLPQRKIMNEDDHEIDNPEFLNHPARHYRIMIEMEAYITRIDEYLAHAERDGKIHSIISRMARTSRFTSTTPNLQNQNMKIAAGYLIAPPGYRLAELDYSNAENKTGAMVAGDSAFAMATETGDFHSNQAAIYFKELWQKALAEDDRATLKQLRFMGKSVTFGTAYGMGVMKLAASLKKTVEEARAILDNKEHAYPKVTERKKEAANRAQQRLDEGLYPSYTTLWTGARVAVPSFFDENGKRKAAGYKSWNYIQQGGVAEMIARATVEITEWLLDNQYQTYIALNVHDSLVLAVKIEEYEQIMPEIIRIMCRQMPEHFCRRTVPKVHFVSEIGPENAQKWGYVDGVDYPWSFDHFINQWGVHKLPEEELAKPAKKREAPTWIGNLDDGWTLEKEIEEIANERIQTT